MDTDFQLIGHILVRSFFSCTRLDLSLRAGQNLRLLLNGPGCPVQLTDLIKNRASNADLRISG